MPSNEGNGRMPRRVAAAVALAVVLAACGSASTVDLESLGLMIEADIQAGSRFETVVPARPDTTIDVVSAPPGVTASISEASDGESIVLSVVVEGDTPRGAYNLALRVVQDGEEYELGWPFEVVEPAGAAATLPGSVEAVLTVEIPQVGDVFPSPSVVSGLSSTDTVGYLLTGGGDVVLAEGTIDVVDGEFSSELEFANTCCIEMLLEVYHPGVDGLTVAIPLAFPESR
jgi:hypothetical protein